MHIRDLREDNDMTQQQVADYLKSGKIPTHNTKQETGKFPLMF